MPRTISEKYGSAMSPSSTPIMCERRVTSARARAEGEYWRAETAASTRRRVAAATGYSDTGLRTRETVVIETPARRATSSMPAMPSKTFSEDYQPDRRPSGRNAARRATRGAAGGDTLSARGHRQVMSAPDPRRLSLNQATTEKWGMAQTIDGSARAGVGWIGLWRHKVAEIGVPETARRGRAAGLEGSRLCRGGVAPAGSV